MRQIKPQVAPATGIFRPKLKTKERWNYMDATLDILNYKVKTKSHLLTWTDPEI